MGILFQKAQIIKSPETALKSANGLRDDAECHSRCPARPAGLETAFSGHLRIRGLARYVFEDGYGASAEFAGVPVHDPIPEGFEGTVNPFFDVSFVDFLVFGCFEYRLVRVPRRDGLVGFG